MPGAAIINPERRRPPHAGRIGPGRRAPARPVAIELFDETDRTVARQHRLAIALIIGCLGSIWFGRT
jgi:hypothetical protein